MSRPAYHGSDRDPAEQPRDGGADDLARLLAAASTPAHPDELSGEPVVLSAFRAHHEGRIRRPPGRRSVPAALAVRFLTVKVALASVLAVAATGGVALAATTGVLPDALVGAGWTGTPARPHSTSAPQVGVAATPSPTPAPRDLCRAYRDRTSESEGGMLDDPHFRTLIEVAGGRADVPGYCDALLAGDGAVVPPTAGGSAEPSDQPARRTGKPSYPPGKPTSLPGNQPSYPPGKPSSLPGNRPTDRPGNKPTDRSGKPDRPAVPRS
jgi:hypothetical protein